MFFQTWRTSVGHKRNVGFLFRYNIVLNTIYCTAWIKKKALANWPEWIQGERWLRASQLGLFLWVAKRRRRWSMKDSSMAMPPQEPGWAQSTSPTLRSTSRDDSTSSQSTGWNTDDGKTPLCRNRMHLRMLTMNKTYKCASLITTGNDQLRIRGKPVFSPFNKTTKIMFLIGQQTRLTWTPENLDERHQTQQCRWPEGLLSKQPGLHYTWAVPRADCLHATPHWCSNSCKRSPTKYWVHRIHTFQKPGISV